MRFLGSMILRDIQLCILSKIWTMLLIDRVKQYLSSGLIWDVDLVNQLHDCHDLAFRPYSTKDAWHRIFSEKNLDKEDADVKIGNAILLEGYDTGLTAFYSDHGLDILGEEELEAIGAKDKLEAALHEVQRCNEAFDTVMKLVKAIQVIKIDDPEYDTSYTHPDVPFSIFVSVGGDTSQLSNLRVAESIIHEAMHLKLTLIERICPLIHAPQTLDTLYSPWRYEMRPVQGVLHGAFVFFAIQKFYESICDNVENPLAKDFISNRIETISNELEEINELKEVSSLTKDGKNLSSSLLT